MEGDERIKQVMRQKPDANPRQIADELDVELAEVLRVQKRIEVEPQEDFRHSGEGEGKEISEKQVSEEFQKRVDEHGRNLRDLKDAIGETVVGQEDIVENILLALMCDGHVLLEGVPGLGKSLLVETLSVLVSGTDFNRIQFVPDMLPSDIIGQRVYNQKKGEFYVNKGPVFANFILADEINRAPPKTQAAMMEVMQEEKVNLDKKTFELESPYLVLATQNPLEQKGTYPLPEAIMDRFFMKLLLDYPQADEEADILKQNTIRNPKVLDKQSMAVSGEDILEMQDDVREIYISEDVEEYIIEIVNTLRDRTDKKLEMLKYIDYGPSPRASIWLSMGASAKAMMEGRTYVMPKDVQEVALPVLRHRVDLNYEGKIKDISTDEVVENALSHVEVI